MPEVGIAYVTVAPSAKGFKGKLEQQISPQADKAGKSSGNKFGIGFGKAVAAVGGVAAIGGIIKRSSQLEQEFGKTMNVLQATSGASGREMQSLSKLAMKMGADTVFSANDASQAMLELARGGITPANIAAGALQGTLTLAAAGELSMGDAANTAVKAMGQFNLQGKDMNSIAAALAGAANASSASVGDMAQALAQGGLAANSVGFSIQETTGILAAFSNAGLEGSDAGTSLKTMLDRLQPSTEAAGQAFDQLGLIAADGSNKLIKSNGEFKSAAQIAELLQRGTEKLTAAESKRLITQAFGSDAQRAATILAKEGAEGLRGLIKQTSDQSAAEKQAAANMKGTAGAMERLSGSIETAQLALGQALAPTIVKVANFLSDEAVPAVSKFIGEMQSGEGAGGDFADILGNLVSVGKGVLNVFQAIPGPVAKYGIQIGLAAAATSKLLSLTKVGALTSFATDLLNVEKRAGATASAMSRLGGIARTGGIAAGLVGVADSSNRASKGMGALQGAASGALAGGALGAFAGPPGALIGGAIGGLAGGLIGLSTSARDAGNSAQSSKTQWDQLTTSIEALSTATDTQIRTAALQKLEQEGLISAARGYGISQRDLISASLGQEGAQRRVGKALREAALGFDISAAGANGLLPKLRQMSGDFEANSKRVREATAATTSWADALRPLGDKRLAVKVETLGMEPTLQQFKNLAEAEKLTPKQIRIIAQANGFDLTRDKFNQIKDAANGINRTKVSPKTSVAGFEKSYEQLFALQRESDDLGKRKPKPTASLIDLASKPIGRVDKSLAGLNRRDAKPSVNLNTAGFFGAVGRASAALDQAARTRTATIRVETLRDGTRRSQQNVGGGIPGRAKGGPVSAGRMYLVGERGPELFTARQSGHITSHSALRSNGVPVAGVAGGGMPSSVTLVVGDREMQAWFEESFDAEMALN